MALRDLSDVLFTKNNGNFLGLIELMSRYDPVLMEHVNEVKTKKVMFIISAKIYRMN